MITKEEFKIYEEARKKLKIRANSKTISGALDISKETSLGFEKVIIIMNDADKKFRGLRNGNKF